MTDDPRPQGRIRDPELMHVLHTQWLECVVCGIAGAVLSLHHVLKNPRQDVREGLVMLCGDGVQGCHGRVEAHDPHALRALAWHIVLERPDVVQHLIDRLKEDGAREWLGRHLLGLMKAG